MICPEQKQSEVFRCRHRRLFIGNLISLQKQSPLDMAPPLVYSIKVIEQKTVTETVACMSEESEPGMVKAGMKCAEEHPSRVV